MRPLAGTEVFADPQEDSALPVRRLSDSKGDFCFEGLATGDYAIEATCARYLSTNYGAKRAGGAGLVLHIAGEASLSIAPIKMAPQAVISGLVLDEDGDPAPDAKVSLLKSRWTNGKQQPDLVRETVTDDRGRYRFSSLRAGSYSLVADPVREGPGMLTTMFLDEVGQPQRQIEVNTYYKNSLSFTEATPIRLSAGEELTNLSITLAKTESRHASGQACRELSNISPRLLYLIGELNAGSRLSAPVTINDDGSFLAEGVRPGRYVLEGPGVKRQRVDLTGGDVDGLIVECPTPVDLSIMLHTEGGPAKPKCSIPRSLLLEPKERDMAQTAEAEATFENKFKAVVWPGRYQIATAVPSCFVKRFLVDGVTQSANSFEIGNGTAASIDVLLSSAVASLDGQVSGVRDRLSEGSTLLLEKEREPDLSMEQVAGADGKFQWNSLEPGKYRLYAFEDFDREEWGNPRLAELLASKSLEFQIEEGEHRQVVVPLISVAEFQQAWEKLEY
jgi:uncharacterized protein (DUF2141 family)